jgi:hypothetical protein
VLCMEHMGVALNFVTAEEERNKIVLNLHIKDVRSTDSPGNLLSRES